MKISKTLFTCMITIVLSFDFSDPAHACSVHPDYRSPSIKQRAQAAKYVLEVSSELNSSPYSKSIKLTVHRWLKGSGPNTITVRGFGPSAACKSEPPKSSERVIIFAKGDADSGTIDLNYLGVHDAVTSSSKAEEVLASLNGGST